MFKKSIAARENVRLKIGMTGPSGAGKTYSALQLAYGIAGDWKRIAVADTENGSALYYANISGTQDRWAHIPFDPDVVQEGYHPKNWVKLLKFAEQDGGIDVLILDSISHEWEGKGGCLELVDSIAGSGNRFSPWKTVTPLHTAFLDAIRLSPLHVIATMRSKQDYVLEQNEKGKMAPKKVGLKSVAREGTDYEFGIVFDIAMNHHATCGKDRTGLLMPRGEFKITPAVGQELVKWASEADAPFNPTNRADQAWLWGELKAKQFTGGKEGAQRILNAMAGRARDELAAVMEKQAAPEAPAETQVQAEAPQ
jgi:hypothetical protein